MEKHHSHNQQPHQIIFKPTQCTIITIGILQCLKFLTRPQTVLQEIKIYTEKTIATKVNAKATNQNQYRQQLKMFQQTHNISISFASDKANRIRELDDLSLRYANQQNPIQPFHYTVPATLLTVDHQEIVEAIAEPLLQSRHLPQLEKLLKNQIQLDSEYSQGHRLGTTRGDKPNKPPAHTIQHQFYTQLVTSR